ncbi:hypothetical protein OS493_014879 [Desmophyllum pertusum]|uniref:Uncharacterized protein n=1 Tax=Desmophyllum pertusum TaxID=174260 RepID=A0A9W9YDB9_9CNID|nr:hypothetical protein OS493_014879 [Desmophyllum pertusum]
MNTRNSAPSRDTKRIIIVDIHQPNPIRTKPEIQVESGAITKTSTSDQPESFKHQTRHVTRSKSSDENALLEMINRQKRARVTRSRSCGSISMHMRGDHDHRRLRGTVMNRRISAPSRDTKRIIIVDIHQPNPIRTKPEIQVESGAITKTSTSDQPESFKHHTRHVTRSKSSDENALLEMINRQKHCQQEAIQRPQTSPS